MVWDADWQMWPDLIADETCQQIIDLALSRPAQTGVVSQGDYIPEVRTSEIRWFYPQDPEVADIYNVARHHFLWANANAWGFHIDWLPSLQFTTYRDGPRGHYTWHQDWFWRQGDYYQRKLSMVIQLSDPATYEGGDLELDCREAPATADLRKRGSLIVFPSFVHHRVTPVTQGVRHSLVAWMEGPRWR